VSFLILDITEAHNWAELQVPLSKPRRIPADRRPTVLQADRDAAERELLRLAKRYPNRTFLLFEPTAKGVTIKVPTHHTLAGKVIGERAETLLVKVSDVGELDDDLPF
jgi:hypothetical protein